MHIGPVLSYTLLTSSFPCASSSQGMDYGCKSPLRELYTHEVGLYFEGPRSLFVRLPGGQALAVGV